MIRVRPLIRVRGPCCTVSSFHSVTRITRITRIAMIGNPSIGKQTRLIGGVRSGVTIRNQDHPDRLPMTTPNSCFRSVAFSPLSHAIYRVGGF